MTKHETNILNQHIGEWREYRENDKEFKERIINLLEKQDAKIDKLHKIQEDEINQIKYEISGEEGVKVRLTKLEKINKTAIRIVMGIGTAIGTGLTYFWEFIFGNK